MRERLTALAGLPRLLGNFLAILVGFLTAIPVPPEVWPREEIPLSKALPLSPLVGIFLGGLTGLALWIFRLLLPPLPAAWLALALYVILGWSLHLDGLADLADGWGSHRRGEAMRRIMKDSRIGCHGTLALVCALGAWSSLAAAVPGGSLVGFLAISGAAGRFGLVSACALGSYPWDSGMGKDVVDNTDRRGWVLSGLLTLSLIPLSPLGVPLALLVSVLVARGLSAFASATLGGSNGDVLGATEVLCETASLACLLATARYFLPL